MYYKVYESKYGVMVAVADEGLIGKKFKFNDTEFFVNPRFYKGESGNKAEIVQLLRNAVSCNLIGTEAVACGKEAGLVTDANILQIAKKVPHAQAIVMQI